MRGKSVLNSPLTVLPLLCCHPLCSPQALEIQPLAHGLAAMAIKHIPPSSRCPQLTLFTRFTRGPYRMKNQLLTLGIYASLYVDWSSGLQVSCFSPQLSKPWPASELTNRISHFLKQPQLMSKTPLDIDHTKINYLHPLLSPPPPLVMEHLLLFAFC